MLSLHDFQNIQQMLKTTEMLPEKAEHSHQAGYHQLSQSQVLIQEHKPIHYCGPIAGNNVLNSAQQHFRSTCGLDEWVLSLYFGVLCCLSSQEEWYCLTAEGQASSMRW
ncbi:hypothetical protein CHARACLAT_029324 [Characodon lateralis]|uniref:Uncharacterized protein n=1 Tax=Characodon lateralis TaxID=208331 RepID=A0ABU7ENV1_9TELE|nr:hypothetical protein [Characodon lateralis]